ncbi:hypothetical protein ACFL02_04075 [Planctomycetota bacterium]
MNNQNQTDYIWIELAARLPEDRWARHHWIQKDNYKEKQAWLEKHNHTEVYESIFMYKNKDHQSDFIGPLFFDIDAPDLEKAHIASVGTCQLLEQRLGIDTESLDISFSGSKGFHIVISPEVFGGIYHKNWIKICRVPAEKITKSGVKHIDMSVYSSARLWRCKNTKHRNTGLYKIPLSYKELCKLGAEQIRQLASQPRSDDWVTPYKSDKLINWIRNTIAILERSSQVNKNQQAEFTFGWRIPPCIRALENTTLPDGIRHETYKVLARYFAWLGAHAEETMFRLLQLDARHPITDPDYIYRIVQFAQQHPGFVGCNSPVLRLYCSQKECFYAELKNVKQIKEKIRLG